MGARFLTPTDYLFLGAVSGLVFGASEAVPYLTHGAGLGRGTAQDVVAALAFAWRFPTDPMELAALTRQVYGDADPFQ